MEDGMEDWQGEGGFFGIGYPGRRSFLTLPWAEILRPDGAFMRQWREAEGRLELPKRWDRERGERPEEFSPRITRIARMGNTGKGT